MKKIFITLAIMMLLSASNLFAQEITPGKEIDLGLPSGTIWAAWNVGATSPEEYGDYYAWGETTTKEAYTKETYKYYNKQTKKYINIGNNISGTKYDVARQKWGGSWRMPTMTEIYELVRNCRWTWCQYKGVNGYKVTGNNGNSIFVPAAGYRNGTSLNYDGIQGRYWSAMLGEGYGCYDAWNLIFNSGNYYNGNSYGRDYGHSVRPVK